MKQLKRKSSKRTGVWLALGAVLFVCAWRGWVVAHRPPDAAKIAEEIGSIWHVPGKLQPNHANTALIFEQLTETGMGIFFGETSGGKKTLVYEQAEKDSGSWQKFGMLGWSPDDRLFAVAYPPNDPKQPDEVLIIGNGTNGAVITRLEVSFLISELAWVSPRAFAYSFWDGDNLNLSVIERQPDDNWIQKHLFKKVGGKEMTGLVATSARSVAWREGAGVWTLDFADGLPQKLWEAAGQQLVGFSYAAELGEFLLNCRDANGQVLIRYNPRFKSSVEVGRIGDGTNVIQKVTWFNRGPAYGQRTQKEGREVFVIRGNGAATEESFSAPGETYDYTFNGDCLYLAGTLTNARPGIWVYDLKSKELNNVGSSLDRKLRHAKIVSPMTDRLTNSTGAVRTYYVWAPTRISSGKKYPVIINQTIGGGPYSQLAPNVGYYFASVHRPGWGEGLETWQEDVMKLYEIMTRNPQVDTNRIYLSGASAETYMMNRLLIEKPELWRGAILLSPSLLPDLTKLRVASLFIVGGSDDGNALEHLTKYQNQAAAAGIQVKLLFLQGSKHIVRSTTGHRAQLEQAAEFLSHH